MTHRLLITSAAVALLAGAASAETRQLDAHEHGHGALNIAIEAGVVAMEFEAPGADIVGFEHAAETDADRASIEEAIAALAKPGDLFVLPAAAGCTVTSAEVSLVADGDEEGHDEAHEGEEAHDDHEEHADHDAHEGEGGHAEFHAEYGFTCADTAAIQVIDFPYFDRFPNAMELEIQLISDKGAKGFEVERDDPRLDLTGAI